MGLPALMGWAFFICEGDVGFMAGGEGCLGGSADGGREGGFNFGESDGIKALQFENQEPQMVE